MSACALAVILIVHFDSVKLSIAEKSAQNIILSLTIDKTGAMQAHEPVEEQL